MSGAASAAHVLNSNYHSYASGSGNDLNPCTFLSPCLTLFGAYETTVAGGEVHCSDSGIGTSNMTISKNITIDCAGASAGQWFFVINGANIVVTLRNISIFDFAGGVAVPGIDFQNGAALFVENCAIERFRGDEGVGINFSPASGVAKLHVTNCVIKTNGNASTGGGIYIQPAAGAVADVTIDRTQIQNNRIGIFANGAGTTRGVVRSSVVSGNATWGIGAQGARSSLMIENTNVSGNQVGIVAKNSASVVVSRSSIVFNRTGLSASAGGTLSTYKNNDLNGNTADGVFTATVVQH